MWADLKITMPELLFVADVDYDLEDENICYEGFPNVTDLVGYDEELIVSVYRFEKQIKVANKTVCEDYNAETEQKGDKPVKHKKYRKRK